MSSREQVIQLVNTMPEYKVDGLLGFLRVFLDDAAEQEHIPNAETIAAFEELENGGGKVFTGSTEDMIAAILAEED